MFILYNRLKTKTTADNIFSKGSRLLHLHGLLKIHKKDLAMCPMLSATDTYKYNLAKWLDEKLNPLSTNEYTINDVFKFAGEIRDMEFVE